MATLGGTNLTLADWSKQLEPDGGITTSLVEILSQTNEMLMDMVWVEANGPTSHRSVIRTGLPSTTWRQYYQGVQPSKSTTAPVDDAMGMLEARSVVDKKLADLNRDVAQFRLNESFAFMEAMNQEMQQTVIYGNQATAASEFNGLSPRYNDNTTAASKENIIDGGGTSTDNCSIWLICWSSNHVHGIFPPGTPAGLQRSDLGIDNNYPDGLTPAGYYQAYVDLYEWSAGMVVRDWRYVVRMANIDVSNLVGETSAADILKLMTKAVHKIPALGVGRPAFYCNNTVLTMLDIQAQNKANVYLTIGEEEGRAKVMFRGIPIRRCDQLTLTEAQVT